MAMKGLVGKVISQGDAAIGAFIHETAFLAEREGRKTPPVQEEESLLSLGSILL
jgi:hypothetical protein